MGSINRFFTIAKKVQDTRHKARSGYLDRMRELEPMKGSEYYKEEARRAKETMDAVLAGCKSYHGEFRIILDDMRENASNRALTAPSEGQERICRMLAMKNTLTKDDLVGAARACKDSPLALDILDDMAREKGVANFHADEYSDNSVMTDSTVKEVIDSLEAGLADFLASDRKRAARLSARFQAMNYGTEIDEMKLAERDLFSNEAGCLAEIGGLTGDRYRAFVEAVDY